MAAHSGNALFTRGSEIMSKFPICLAATVAVALAALLPAPASAGGRGGYVEGGYGLEWYGGRPYHYTPFGEYGGQPSYQRRYVNLPIATGPLGILGATIFGSRGDVT
jgi:hypothetical protein